MIPLATSYVALRAELWGTLRRCAGESEKDYRERTAAARLEFAATCALEDGERFRASAEVMEALQPREGESVEEYAERTDPLRAELEGDPLGNLGEPSEARVAGA
jgi:hypothetical protein